MEKALMVRGENYATKEKKARRCNRCILPLGYPGLSFDKSGVCNFCKAYDLAVRTRNYEVSRRALARILDKHRGRSRNYDCVIGMSGGKDSTYVLYLLSEVFHMRVLAVHFDNGFVSPYAKRNLEKVVAKLGVGFITVRHDWPTMREMYKMFLRRAGEFCTPCNVGISIPILKFAMEEGVRLVFSGVSRILDVASPRMYASKYLDRCYFLNVINGQIPRDMLHGRFLQSWMEILRRATSHVMWLKLPDYVEWDIKNIRKILRREFGWEEDPNGKFHADCMASDIKDYLVYRRWGFSDVTAKLAALVRDRQLTRQEALERVKSEEANKEPDFLDDFLNKIGISRTEFENSIDKTHTRIPNCRECWWFGSFSLAKRLFKRA